MSLYATVGTRTWGRGAWLEAWVGPVAFYAAFEAGPRWLPVFGDPTWTEGTIVLNTRFISQSSPDIWKKLKKAEEGPQTPQQDLLNLAFQIFNNQEEQAKLEKAQQDQAKYHLLATALHGSKPPSTNKDRKPPGPSFKCSKEGHWTCSCLKPRPPPGPRPSCSIKGHWKVNIMSHPIGETPCGPLSEPMHPVLEAQSLNHWTTGKSLEFLPTH